MIRLSCFPRPTKMASHACAAGLVLSLTTLLLILVPCEGRPGPPEHTSLFTSPTSIRVEWNSPTLDPGATVKGFRLQYKLGVNGKLVKLKLGAEYSHDIEGLAEPCGDYRFRMSTSSSKGLSRYSSFSQVDRVLSAPQNVNAAPSSLSARITWSPPPNGFCITGYQLKYGPNEHDLQSIELSAELTQYMLTDLQPGTSYLMSLAALANEQVSEEAYFQWYQAGPPSPPANLKASPSSTQLAVVMWSPTSSGITRYEYLYGPVGTPDTKLTSGYVGASTTLVELGNLFPGEEYIVKVTSVNGIGQSEAAEATWMQPAPAPVEPPSKPVPATPGEITVEITSSETALASWTRPEGDVDITGYIVGFGLAGSDNSELTLFSVGPDDLSEELDGLKPDVEYVVTIQAYNDVGDGPIQSTEWRQEAPVVPLTPPPEERCAQQQQCIQQFESRSPGAGEVCPRILGYLNCLQRLRDACMEDAGYRGRVASVRNMFLTEGCNRNPRRTESGSQGPPVPEGFDARPVENIPTEVIPPPVNVTATLLSPTIALISWVDTTLWNPRAPMDNPFYIVRYHALPGERFLEERIIDTSYVADSLEIGVPYEFDVQLVLGSDRRSAFSIPVTVISRDPEQGKIPARFAITQVTVSGPTTAKAVLNWLPPPETRDITEYTIEYTDSEQFRDPATVWEHLTIDGSKMTAVLEGLRTDTEYHIRIRARFGPKAGPPLAVPAAFTTPVVPPSSKTTKQCGESELDAVTRRVNFLWDGVADNVQRPPLFGVPIPYCEDEFAVEECHGLFCFCVPGKKPPALRDPHCTADVPPCRREYNAARQALDEARGTGMPAMAAQLPHCRDNGYYQPKQCSGTMCYCVTEDGTHTGQERPMWEATQLRCE